MMRKLLFLLILLIIPSANTFAEDSKLQHFENCYFDTDGGTKFLASNCEEMKSASFLVRPCGAKDLCITKKSVSKMIEKCPDGDSPRPSAGIDVTNFFNFSKLPHKEYAMTAGACAGTIDKQQEYLQTFQKIYKEQELRGIKIKVIALDAPYDLAAIESFVATLAKDPCYKRVNLKSIGFDYAQINSTVNPQVKKYIRLSDLKVMTSPEIYKNCE